MLAASSHVLKGACVQTDGTAVRVSTEERFIYKPGHARVPIKTHLLRERPTEEAGNSI